jgi:hypothetical protein
VKAILSLQNLLYPAPEKFITFNKFNKFNFSILETPSESACSRRFHQSLSETRTDLKQWARTLLESFSQRTESGGGMRVVGSKPPLLAPTGRVPAQRVAVGG